MKNHVAAAMSEAEYRHIRYLSFLYNMSMSALLRMAWGYWLDQEGEFMCHRSAEEVMLDMEAISQDPKYKGLDLDRFAEIVIASVEGQVRSYVKDHPEVLEGDERLVKEDSDRRKAEGRHPRLNGKCAEDRLVDSISKRITRQLLCPQTKARLIEALGSCEA